MGIVITKYEDTENENIAFDVSKFDYDYDDETFPADSADDFDQILLENGDVYIMSREADTTDSMGHVIDIDTTDYRIYGMFQDITLKDRQIQDMGLAVLGNRKFYFKPSYTMTSAGVDTTYQIKEGDIIKDNKLYAAGTSIGQFRVVKILKQWWEPGTEVYRVAIVKSINLDGTA